MKLEAKSRSSLYEAHYELKLSLIQVKYNPDQRTGCDPQSLVSYSKFSLKETNMSILPCRDVHKLTMDSPLNNCNLADLYRVSIKSECHGGAEQGGLLSSVSIFSITSRPGS